MYNVSVQDKFILTCKKNNRVYFLSDMQPDTLIWSPVRKDALNFTEKEKNELIRELASSKMMRDKVYEWIKHTYTDITITSGLIIIP